MIEHSNVRYPQQYPSIRLSGWLADELQRMMKEYDTARRLGDENEPARKMTFEEWRDYKYPPPSKSAIPDQAPAHKNEG